MKNRSKIFIISAVTLLSLQALTILFSWIVNAMCPSIGVNSLLSGFGLRWLLSSLPSNLSNQNFIWYLLFSVFVGTFVYSELPKKILYYSKNDFRERFAIKLFLLIIIISFLICATLALFPHSSFLGVSGHVFPGPFIASAILLLGLAMFGGSVVFLLLSGKVSNWEDAEKACIYGLQSAAPVIVIYFLLKELVEMVLFVL